MNLFNKTPTPRAGIPHGPSDMVCPYNQRQMSEVCHACPKWVKVAGMDPQDERKQIDHWNCSDAFMMPILIELGRQMRSNAKAIETLTKESQKTDVQAQTMINTLLTVVNKAIQQPPQPLPNVHTLPLPMPFGSAAAINGHAEELKRLE